MKNFYAIFYPLIFFTTLYSSDNESISSLSSDDTVLNSSTLSIHSNNSEETQSFLPSSGLRRNMIPSEDNFTPPYTCPACIISPIKKTFLCFKTYCYTPGNQSYNTLKRSYINPACTRLQASIYDPIAITLTGAPCDQPIQRGSCIDTSTRTCMQYRKKICLKYIDPCYNSICYTVCCCWLTQAYPAARDS